MSNAERKANLPDIIRTCEPKFTELARMHGVPDFTFAREAAFALQALKKNDYLAEVAVGAPDSLKDAIINVAAVGLSLSPVLKLAYIVPRDRKICLDITGGGLIKLAVDAGSILLASPQLVRDKDEFEFLGPITAPHHKFNHKVDRGPIVGVYTLAKLPDGSLLIDYMSIAKVHHIRDQYSESYKAHLSKGKATPWVTEEDEMVLKTSVKHAFKTWPKGKSSPAMERALRLVTEADDTDLETKELPPAEPTPTMVEGFGIIREMLEILERSESAYVGHLCRTHNRKIEKIEDLTQLEIDQSITFLQGLIDAQAKKIAALQSRGGKNENAG